MDMHLIAKPVSSFFHCSPLIQSSIIKDSGNTRSPSWEFIDPIWQNSFWGHNQVGTRHTFVLHKICYQRNGLYCLPQPKYASAGVPMRRLLCCHVIFTNVDLHAQDTNNTHGLLVIFFSKWSFPALMSPRRVQFAKSPCKTDATKAPAWLINLIISKSSMDVRSLEEWTGLVLKLRITSSSKGTSLSITV